jgi:hypothetical integral membrane protein (TIGR02206 family)
MSELSLFSGQHLLYIGGALVVWILVPTIGRTVLNRNQRFVVVLILIGFTLGQEITNDLIRWRQGVWTVAENLPLHMCGFSLFTTTYALYTKNQTAFELSYFWGLAGAIQAILTPEFSTLGPPITRFLFFLSHTLIILNVLWLVFVDGMRCRPGSLLNVILVTNGVAFIMTFVNKILHSNYWFICAKPDTASPFMIGPWPWYLIGIEVFGILILAVIYIPMVLARKRS